MRLYTRADVCRLTGYCAAHTIVLEKAGHFPRSFKLSPGGGKYGKVAYVADEVDVWLRARAASRLRVNESDTADPPPAA